MTHKIYQGDCIEVMSTLLADQSAHCCVTSPPYFGLRDYGVEGQIGLEETPGQYVARLVEVFREVRRVLRDDGTLWLNLGDSYTPVNRGENAKPRKEYPSGIQAGHMHSDNRTRKAVIQGTTAEGFKQKDLLGIPWMVAFALRADGWYLRQDIIWHKPNPMPESVQDRCTKAHEYIFILSKSKKYYYDADAIKEQAVCKRPFQFVDGGEDKQRGHSRRHAGFNGRYKEKILRDGAPKKRNRRSVWTVTTKPFKGAHFATFPVDLIEPCILAGCPAGGTVIDPFGGAGTTALAARKHGRNAVLIELNPEYVNIAERRLAA